MPSSHMRQRVAKRESRAPAWAIGLMLFLFTLMLAWATWAPTFLNTKTGGDQILEAYFQRMICSPEQITGWPINDGDTATALGAFVPSLPAFLATKSACAIAAMAPFSATSAFLVVGIFLTVFTTSLAARSAGLHWPTALLIGYGMATAPCSFSRFGHLQLSQLWPIMPCIVTCAILLGRSTYPAAEKGSLHQYGSFGILMGALSFAAQDYYAVFSCVCIFTCYIVGMCRQIKVDRFAVQADAPDRASPDRRWRYRFIASGYIAVMIFTLASKRLYWSIPSWSLGATNRWPIEQHIYGFWPLNVLTSPIINPALKSAFAWANIPTVTPFGSSSGIVVLISFGILLACWTSTKPLHAQRLPSNSAYIFSYGGVLLTTLLLSAFVAAPGGLGMLFNVFVSPQLRAMNRITPYFYCAALTICAISLCSLLSNLLHHRPETRP